MAHDHSHGGNTPASRLWMAFAITAAFMVVETAIGFISGSLALLSDAAHMLTDVAALGISIAAISLGRRTPDSKRSFGYQRFEILAAAFNAVILFLVAFYILYEAVQRFRDPAEVASVPMLVVAILGLIVNLISMRILKTSSSESLNAKGAYLEVWADMVGSVGVIAGAIVIHLTGWQWVDSVVAVGIGFWVVPRTWSLLSDSLNILLQGVPEEVELSRIEADLLAIDGIVEVHDLHVWALTSGTNVLTAHLVLADGFGDGHDVLKATTDLLRDRYEIVRTTLQTERLGFHGKASEDHDTHTHEGRGGNRVDTP